MPKLPNLFELTRPQLTAFLNEQDFGSAHAGRLWRYLYRELVTDFAAMDELPLRLRDRLFDRTRLATLTAVQKLESVDGLTQKYLLGLDDGRSIETVSMQYTGRTTACLSSQVGCAVGCVFCATGQAGFTRHLSVGEIVAQAVFIEHALRSNSSLGGAESLRNVVIMGMGEPLLNYDAVMTALEILSDSSGLAIGMKRMTLSTVGVVPGIIRLDDEQRPYSLAVSLHATTQDERVALIPAARTWPLDALLEACRYYASKVNRRIFFEWTFIRGANDSIEQAEALVRLLDGIPAQVNLIPLNATNGYDGVPGNMETLDRFRATLRARGLPVSIRQRRGIDIAAGCGQLAGQSRDQRISIASP